MFNLSLHKTKRAACNLCSPAQQCTDFIQTESVYDSDGGIMVSIAAFQAVDPGSIPGRRNFVFSFYLKKNIPLPGIEPGPPG